MNPADDGYPALRAMLARRSSAAALARLDAAHALAARTHAGQRRRSGGPYIEHPVTVAAILAEWQQPLPLVVAGLLHDVPEVVADLRPARAVAGRRVARLISELERLEGRDWPAGRHPRTRFRRDLVILKLADRLHNARTWEFVPRETARLKASETIAVFGPAARALGMDAVGEELLALSAATLGTAAVAAPASDRVSRRLLARAVALLPAAERDRYQQEWAADLAGLATRRDRTRFAAGLLWSAAMIRASR